MPALSTSSTASTAATGAGAGTTPASSSSASASASASASSTGVNLISSDHKKFAVDRALAMKSGLIRMMIGCGNNSAVGGSSSGSNDSSAQEIPVPNITGKVLRRVIDYLHYHQNVPAPVLEKPLRDDIYNLGLPRFDIDFIEKGRTQQDIYDIITAAMYLDIPSLVDLGCAKIASLIKGKNPREIRATFGLEGDFTEAQKYAVFQTYPFLAQADEASKNMTDGQIRELLDKQRNPHATSSTPAGASGGGAKAAASSSSS